MAVGRRAGSKNSASLWTVCLLRTSLFNMGSIVMFLFVGLLPQFSLGQIDQRTSCYDSQGNAQRCMPEFVNAAFNLSAEATNTCGVTRVNEYCLQTGVTGETKSCHFCDATLPGSNHPSQFMTDFNNKNNWTWWQSETMLEGIQFPVVVNLTLHLRKAFDVTYVRLRFHSPRPESFAIYKRTTQDGQWIPYQFYSASCERTYGLNRRGYVPTEKEDTALCADDYSDISPLTGGSVPFSTLEGRPSAYKFENSPVLQEWVTATDIRIVLTRMNTFGDEVFGDPQVLKSYFYAVSDLAVGARCKCNGHARECHTLSAQEGYQGRLVCRCEHNTMGPDCEQCHPNYNDRPWDRATETDANECLPCDCNNMANSCYFDEDLYRRTGHGGHCIDCRDNTDGVHCELCKDNHYRRPDNNRCVPCNCDPTGSESLQCDDRGQCQCKPGVIGERCERCEPNHYDFGLYGCRACACVTAGSENNDPRCDPQTGLCYCKENVEGQNCERCKPGFYGLEESNPYGCISCFCYGQSSVCDSSTGYFPRLVTTDFQTGKQRWTALDMRNEEIATQYNGILQNLGVSAPSSEMVWFVAPAKYLGDQRFSYNQFFSFKLRLGEEQSRASILDVVFEGAAQRVSLPIYGQSNSVPGLQVQEYRYRLHENPHYQWSPRIKSSDFLTILSNLTAIKIRGTYNAEGVGFIDDITLESASRGFTDGEEVSWVEHCTCPEGFVGQFCESCRPGYKRDPPHGGPFSSCIPCECFGHSDVCDDNSGRCICQHNTEGDFCERCAPGFYGDARQGTADDCKPCPCPNGGPCVQLPDQDVVCTQCEEGYGGNHCDVCLDGWFGDPNGRYGAHRPCRRCDCNENIDPNSVHNCNSTTGECVKCIYSTAGFYCEKCLPSYYGDALAIPKGQCKACNCYPPGTLSAGVLSCDPAHGQCPCLPNVRGLKCDQCEVGFWNINSGSGCEPCMCNRIGSTNNTCDITIGQCMCRTGVTGLKCDTCQRFHYGFSPAGCQGCNCDPEGSLNMQCDEYGNCDCQVSIEGRRCDRCMENKYNITVGCIDCPPCYSLVQERVNIHRGKLRELHNMIINIGSNPSVFNDTEFLVHLNSVNDSVVMLLDEARGAISDDGTLGKQLQDLRTAVQEVIEKSGRISQNIKAAAESSESSNADIGTAEEAIQQAEEALRAAENYIDSEGRAALQRARDALNRFGQQSEQTTIIANRAKILSEGQMEEANRIDILARNALNTSREALRLARETLIMPDKTNQEIQRLRQEYGDADRLYIQTQLVAENARDMANKAYQEALDLYTEATSIHVPGVDVVQLKKNAAEIKLEAEQIKEDAENLMAQNAQLLEDVIKQDGEAEQLLDTGIRHQQRADELLAEVDAARALARNAVDSGEKTLRDANETLHTLIEFDKEVQESKGKADEALDRVPEIQDLIEQAENKTREAGDALRGAKVDADLALSLAVQAQTTAQNASDEASRIRQESETTKERAVKLKDAADDLAAEVANTKEEMVTYEQQATDDEALAKEALERANEAKLTALDASTKVSEALNTVNNIRSVLDDLDMVDTGKLDQLEQSLEEIEQQLQDANLDEQLLKLEASNTQVKDWVRKYNEDISSLQADVDNIEDIKNALPDGCFKNIEIEAGASSP